MTNLMADSQSSLPNKRPNSSDEHRNNHHKRTKPPHQPPPIPAGHAELRLICHVSHVGGLIGKSGSTIKLLQQETGSRIRVDDSLRPGSDHRVVAVVGSTAPDRRVEDYATEVSAVQFAALKVFEKILEVAAAEDDGGGGGGGEAEVFRAVIEEGRAGYVIGKGGKVVESLRRESGAKIRVLLGDHLPHYVPPPLELVEIEGDLSAVKKALLGVCGRLQQCPQVDKSSNKETKPVESTSLPTIHDLRVDPPLQRVPIYMATTSSGLANVARPLSFDAQRTLLYMPAKSSSPITATRPLSFEVDQHANMESRQNQQEVVFKILCSNDRVGGIIGKGGSIIRALQEETGAKISIGPSVTDCDERLVTVTSKEDVDSSYSAAQRAVILVYSRLAEAAVEKGLDTGSNKVSSVSARLLIPSNQVGCLLGKGGTIVSEMRKATGANIRILKGEQLPKCASEDDQVVEITGQFVKIQDAVFQVTGRLRSNLFPSNMTSVPERQTNLSVPPDVIRYERVRDLPIGAHHSLVTSQPIDGLSSLRQGLDSLHNRQRLDHPPWAGSRTSEEALYASQHREDKYLQTSMHHIPLTAKSIDGPSAMRQGWDSLYNHQRLDDLPLGGSRESELILEANRRERIRDLPIDLHHSLATSRSVDGLSTIRQGDSLYNSQRLERSPLAGSLASEMTLNASRHVRERDLPISMRHSFMTSESIDGSSTMRQGLDSLYNSQRLDHSPLASSRNSEVSAFGVNSRSFLNPGRGLAPSNGGAELGSLKRPAIVTNTTVEISVPEEAVSSVYGENGRNLMRIRQVSGAKVVVHEAAPGTRDRTVLISGTPEETQAAQSLLHAFILTGSS